MKYFILMSSCILLFTACRENQQNDGVNNTVTADGFCTQQLIADYRGCSANYQTRSRRPSQGHGQNQNQNRNYNNQNQNHNQYQNHNQNQNEDQYRLKNACDNFRRNHASGIVCRIQDPQTGQYTFVNTTAIYTECENLCR